MNNQLVLEVYIQHVFGKPLIYPANRTAKLFLALTNAKTFNQADLNTIKQLGYEVKTVLNPEVVSV